MTRMRVAICQINTVVGDIDGNVERVLAALGTAAASGAQLAAFPELTLTGYPPEDLVARPSFVDDNLAALDRLAAEVGECAAVVGFVARDADGRLANAAAVCRHGRVVERYAKRLLPNYGVFDEQRWFTPGSGPQSATAVAGVPVGISVCEDVWWPGGPVFDQAAAGARLLVNLNASPYSRGRRAERLAMLTERAVEAGCPIVYVNQVGGQDELVFDGASLVVGADGSLVAAAAQFREEVLVVDVDLGAGAGGAADGATGATDGATGATDGATGATDGALAGRDGLLGPVAPPLGPDAEVYEALVLGTRDYLRKNEFSEAVVGLSGGIDSSLVAVIAADALGPACVHGVAMPSRYSSPGSIEDAVALAANLGIDLRTVPIEEAHATFATMIASAIGAAPAGLTDENLQSRIRGVLLMALSNARGWIVLTTGNKSEMATGYSTLYGDSAGGFAVIKDVPKTLVYRLCRYRNDVAGGEVIPGSVLTKPPSAELRPDQVDEESLPPYEVLDPVLAGYVEEDRSQEELVAAGFDPEVVAQVARLVDRAEYKRRQMPPGVRITTKAFGKDRRMPITNRYRAGVVQRG